YRTAHVDGGLALDDEQKLGGAGMLVLGNRRAGLSLDHAEIGFRGAGYGLLEQDPHPGLASGKRQRPHVRFTHELKAFAGGLGGAADNFGAAGLRTITEHPFGSRRYERRKEAERLAWRWIVDRVRRARLEEDRRPRLELGRLAGARHQQST